MRLLTFVRDVSELGYSAPQLWCSCIVLLRKLIEFCLDEWGEIFSWEVLLTGRVIVERFLSHCESWLAVPHIEIGPAAITRSHLHSHHILTLHEFSLNVLLICICFGWKCSLGLERIFFQRHEWHFDLWGQGWSDVGEAVSDRFFNILLFVFKNSISLSDDVEVLSLTSKQNNAPFVIEQTANFLFQCTCSLRQGLDAAQYYKFRLGSRCEDVVAVEEKLSATQTL